MRGRVALWLPALMVFTTPAVLVAQEGEGSGYTLQAMHEFNGTLRSMWMDLRVEQVEVLTLGQSLGSSRIHRQPFRWVANDERRLAKGEQLTYLVDLTDLPPSSNLPAGLVEAAIDRAMQTWSSQQCLQKTAIVKRSHDGEDPDIFDAAFGYGGLGDFRAADVVVAGWLPAGFFEAVVSGGGTTVLALSVTFVFVGPDGEPTDIDKDGNLDTAANEIYFNEAFGWTVGSTVQESLDIESVALHEIGHSLAIGHIGPPPEAVMNPVYAGARTELTRMDNAALCAIWGTWPH